MFSTPSRSSKQGPSTTFSRRTGRGAPPPDSLVDSPHGLVDTVEKNRDPNDDSNDSDSSDSDTDSSPNETAVARGTDPRALSGKSYDLGPYIPETPELRGEVERSTSASFQMKIEEVLFADLNRKTALHDDVASLGVDSDADDGMEHTGMEPAPFAQDGTPNVLTPELSEPTSPSELSSSAPEGPVSAACFSPITVPELGTHHPQSLSEPSSLSEVHSSEGQLTMVSEASAPHDKAQDTAQAFDPSALSPATEPSNEDDVLVASPWAPFSPSALLHQEPPAASQTAEGSVPPHPSPPLAHHTDPTNSTVLDHHNTPCHGSQQIRTVAAITPKAFSPVVFQAADHAPIMGGSSLEDSVLDDINGNNRGQGLTSEVIQSHENHGRPEVAESDLACSVEVSDEQVFSSLSTPKPAYVSEVPLEELAERPQDRSGSFQYVKSNGLVAISSSQCSNAGDPMTINHSSHGKIIHVQMEASKEGVPLPQPWDNSGQLSVDYVHKKANWSSRNNLMYQKSASSQAQREQVDFVVNTDNEAAQIHQAQADQAAEAVPFYDWLADDEEVLCSVECEGMAGCPGLLATEERIGKCFLILTKVTDQTQVARRLYFYQERGNQRSFVATEVLRDQGLVCFPYQFSSSRRGQASRVSSTFMDSISVEDQVLHAVYEQVSITKVQKESRVSGSVAPGCIPERQVDLCHMGDTDHCTIPVCCVGQCVLPSLTRTGEADFNVASQPSQDLAGLVTQHSKLTTGKTASTETVMKQPLTTNSTDYTEVLSSKIRAIYIDFYSPSRRRFQQAVALVGRTESCAKAMKLVNLLTRRPLNASQHIPGTQWGFLGLTRGRSNYRGKLERVSRGQTSVAQRLLETLGMSG